jgi:hypothetical protein
MDQVRGKVRRRLGRPGAEPEKMAHARRELANGTGIAKTARLVGLGTGTVHKLKRARVSAPLRLGKDSPGARDDFRGLHRVPHIRPARDDFSAGICD